MNFPHPARRLVRPVAAVLLCIALGGAGASADPAGAGRRLYREGLGQDGAPVRATVQGDVEASGTTLACVGCHKRSGLGSFEAGIRAVPVTAPALFGTPRTPYTDESLARAITRGIAADGRPLSPLMPRYRLDAGDTRALAAYLHELGAGRDPGVSDTDLELVTIVAARAPAGEREAVEAVVRRFSEIKNGGSRQEQRRADASRRHEFGEKQIRAYRRWNLSVWTLEGPPDGWPAQLEALYRARPPFAVISGAAGADWPVVHGFCESHELPCILPVTDLAVEGGEGHYTLYYSAGVRLEARVTSRSIAADFADGGRKILVAYADDARGRAALDALQSELPSRLKSRLVLHAVTPGATAGAGDWQAVLARVRPVAVVAWLPQPELQELAAAAGGGAPPARIYTAATFTDWNRTRAPPAFEQRVLHVDPYRLASQGLARFPREEFWLKKQGFDGLETIPAAEALFACHAVGEAMASMSDNYSREYLVETLEHMLDGSRMTTLYPVTTLGTGQRFLAKGAYVLRLQPDTGASRYLSSGWIQP